MFAGREFRAVFISTVRTVHLTSKQQQRSQLEPDWMNGVDDDDVDGSDFGFLSDQRLLNTAMTRAQSLVGVVGDPIALCAIGNCMNVWRAYLKHCSQMHSILPQPFSFNDIKAQVSPQNSHYTHVSPFSSPINYMSRVTAVFLVRCPSL